MFEEIGRTINNLFMTMFILLIIFLPLGIWKLIELILWFINHIRISP